MQKKAHTLDEAFRAMNAAFPLAKGSLALVGRPCIRKSCRLCQSGQKHAGWIFSFRQGGRQGCRYVPKELVPPLRQAIENGRRLEALRAQKRSARESPFGAGTPSAKLPFTPNALSDRQERRGGGGANPATPDTDGAAFRKRRPTGSRRWRWKRPNARSAARPCVPRGPAAVR